MYTDRTMGNRTRLTVTKAFTAHSEDDPESTLDLLPGMDIFAAVGDAGPIVKFTFESRPVPFLIDRNTIEGHTKPFHAE
jgi:hypothetical protein